MATALLSATKCSWSGQPQNARLLGIERSPQLVSLTGVGAQRPLLLASVGRLLIQVGYSSSKMFLCNFICGFPRVVLRLLISAECP